MGWGITAAAPLNGIGWDQVWPVITLGFGVFLSYLAEWFRDKRTTRQEDARYLRELKREHAAHQRLLLVELQSLAPKIVAERVGGESVDRADGFRHVTISSSLDNRKVRDSSDVLLCAIRGYDGEDVQPMVDALCDLLGDIGSILSKVPD
jgi:hypothetical protein